MKEVEVIPLPCGHIHRLPPEEQGKPRGTGWKHVTRCEVCETTWFLMKKEGAIRASKEPM